MVTQRFSLDMVPNDGPAHEARMSQYDGPVRFEIQLFSSKWDFRIPQQASAAVRGRTASGANIEFPATLTSGGLVRFDLPIEVPMEMGRHEMELVVSSAEGELHSTKFVVGVEGNPKLI